MPPYRVAITGCHRMLERAPAGHNWAAAFAALVETEIVAVHDRGAETRERAAAVWGAIAYDDYAAMLEREKPEIVCIATRQTVHAEQIEAAVASGARGILCEKPLATSMAEADRIVGACRRTGAAFLLGLDRRWVPFYRHVRAWIADGLVGEVRVVTSFGVPNLIAHGCHWFDVLGSLAGDPEVAWVMGGVDAGRGDPRDPPGSGVIEFANGVRAFIDRGHGAQVGFDVIGTTGRLMILNDGAETRLWLCDSSGTLVPRSDWGSMGVRRGRRALARAAASDSAGGRAPGGAPEAYPHPRPLPPAPAAGDANIAAVGDLVEAVGSGRPTACDLSMATRSLELGLAFHASHARGGGRVTFPLEDRSLQVNSLPWGNE